MGSVAGLIAAESVLIMEFNEKLQKLRKQKGLTQEELAEALYVSRTAVSKWESGRGYPNIESLKAISKFFSVTVDELLSGGEALTIAEEDHKQKEAHFRDLVFGSLDSSAAMLLFLPFFGQRTDGMAHGVSLISLTEIAPYLRTLYLAAVVGIVVTGILTLALQNFRHTYWVQSKHKMSFLFNAAGALLFIVSLQPYAAMLLFLFLMIKGLLLIRWQ